MRRCTSSLVRIKFIKPSGLSADLGPCFYVAAPTTTITSLVHRPAFIIIIIIASRAPLIDQRNNHFRRCNETAARCTRSYIVKLDLYDNNIILSYAHRRRGLWTEIIVRFRIVIFMHAAVFIAGIHPIYLHHVCVHIGGSATSYLQFKSQICELRFRNRLPLNSLFLKLVFLL